MKFSEAEKLAAAVGAVLVLFGPPGSGKSTRARRKGRNGFDMETIPQALWREAMVKQAPFDVHPLGNVIVVGAADTKIAWWQDASKRLNMKIITVLLLPDREVLRQRRLARDFEDPSKAGQPEYYLEFSRDREQYDMVVDD